MMLSDKKILYLIKTMDLGGAERVTLNLVNHFRDKFGSVTVASSGGIYEKLLREMHVDHYKIKEEIKISNLHSLHNEISALIAERKFDLIHTHHRLVQCAIQMSPLRRFKSIYTSHNIFDDLYQKIIFPDMAVAISSKIKENLLKTSFIKKEKIYQVNLGVESPVMNGTPFSTELIFGFTGRLVEVKGIYIVLDAVKKLFDEGFKLRLVYRGKGEEAELRRRISQYNLDRIVSILPYSVDQDEIYSGFDVLVLPSVMNEGLPMSILEAASKGKAVIAGDAGGVTDFIVNDKTGLLLNPVNVSTVYAAMKKLIENKEMLHTLTANASEKLRTEFSLEAMNRGYEELYSKLL